MSDQPVISSQLLTWYDRVRRDLPWRVPLGSLPDPYHVLLSEVMLQQTQIATVVPYFRAFLERFPTLAALAEAPLDRVLRMWQGLGYYSRARNLHAAARLITERHGGQVPSELEPLLALPGIGRYTAGAIASIAYDRPVPIVDTNVSRVLCRLDGVRRSPRLALVMQKLWARAAQLVPEQRAGDFNSALMELGGRVCTAKNPQCDSCPLSECCVARAKGLQERIPPVTPKKQVPVVERWVFCIGDGDRWLIQQRPSTGRWAGLWQFLTVERRKSVPTPRMMAELFGIRCAVPARLGSLEHRLTHRLYRFNAFLCRTDTDGTVCPTVTGARWVKLDELEQHAMPRPHLRIREMLEKYA